MNKIFLLLLCHVFCVILSCKKPYTKELSVTDSLLTVIQDKKSILDQIDTIKLNKQITEIKQNLHYIQVNYTDTMDRSTAMTLSDYNLLGKYLVAIKQDYQILNHELAFATSQLKNLKNDLIHNSIDNNIVTTSLETELKSVRTIIESIYELKDYYNSTTEGNDSLYAKANEIMSYLNTQKAQ